jgi:hypothetical protein
VADSHPFNADCQILFDTIQTAIKGNHESVMKLVSEYNKRIEACEHEVENVFVTLEDIRKVDSEKRLQSLEKATIEDFPKFFTLLEDLKAGQERMLKNFLRIDELEKRADVFDELLKHDASKTITVKMRFWKSRFRLVFSSMLAIYIISAMIFGYIPQNFNNPVVWMTAGVLTVSLGTDFLKAWKGSDDK